MLFRKCDAQIHFQICCLQSLHIAVKQCFSAGSSLHGLAIINIDKCTLCITPYGPEGVD